MEKIVLLQILIALGSCIAAPAEFYKRVITLPNRVFNGSSELFCTGQPIGANQYIVEFNAILEHHNVINHISVDICDELYSTNYVWDCSHDRLCKPGTRHRLGLYHWGRESNKVWKLPDDVGVAIGNKNRYLLVQVHSATLSNKDDTAMTGMELTIRSSKPKYEFGLVQLGNYGTMPAETKDFKADAACEWNFNTTVAIYGYLVHTHKRGKAVSSYIYRDNKWIEIGRANPQYPEIMMEIPERGLTLQPGDQVVSRCTYDINDKHPVPFGHRAKDEMCIVYLNIIYPTDADHRLTFVQCPADGATFHLKEYFPHVPDNASSTKGDTDQSHYIRKNHWKLSVYNSE